MQIDERERRGAALFLVRARGCTFIIISRVRVSTKKKIYESEALMRRSARGYIRQRGRGSRYDRPSDGRRAEEYIVLRVHDARPLLRRWNRPVRWEEAVDVVVDAVRSYVFDNMCPHYVDGHDRLSTRPHCLGACGLVDRHTSVKSQYLLSRDDKPICERRRARLSIKRVYSRVP